MKKITLDLVVVHGEPRVDSRVISQKLNVQHKATVQLIARHQNRLEKFGLVPFEMEAVKKKRGVKHEKYYLLNESQSIFLLTLSRNTEDVMSLKEDLTRKFMAYRDVYNSAIYMKQLQKQDAALAAQRQAGKLIRREQTDTIQEFVQYATAQGSTQAHRYFCNITKMENQALFLLEQKFKNLRDILDLNQLGLVRTADSIVKKALSEGMAGNLFYKDIYKLAKTRIETLAAIHGKVAIPASQIQSSGQSLIGMDR